jgi:hypothetical protein
MKAIRVFGSPFSNFVVRHYRLGELSSNLEYYCWNGILLTCTVMHGHVTYGLIPDQNDV